MTPTERAALMARAANAYHSGKSIREVATAINLSYGTTYRLLMAAGVTMRTRGGPRRRKSK